MRTPPVHSFKMYQVRGRIEVLPSENIPGGWMVVDNLDGYLVDFYNYSQAIDAARFARAYIRKHGDIYFGSFPYTLTQPLLIESDCEQLDIEYHQFP